jgi:hypothetical protein
MTLIGKPLTLQCLHAASIVLFTCARSTVGSRPLIIAIPNQ